VPKIVESGRYRVPDVVFARFVVIWPWPKVAKPRQLDFSSNAQR
jgi:hypothetical protein